MAEGHGLKDEQRAGEREPDGGPAALVLQHDVAGRPLHAARTLICPGSRRLQPE